MVPELMRREAIDYFACVVEEVDRFMPGFREQLDSGKVPGMVLVHSEESENPDSPHSVRVYELR